MNDLFTILLGIGLVAIFAFVMGLVFLLLCWLEDRFLK